MAKLEYRTISYIKAPFRTALRFTGGVGVFFGFTNNFIGGAEIVLKKFGKTSFYSKSRRGS